MSKSNLIYLFLITNIVFTTLAMQKQQSAVPIEQEDHLDCTNLPDVLKNIIYNYSNELITIRELDIMASSDIKFTDDEKNLIFAKSNKILVIYDLEKNICNEISIVLSPKSKIRFSPNGRFVVSLEKLGKLNKFSIFDGKQKFKKVKELEFHANAIDQHIPFVFSEDNKYMLIGLGNSIILYYINSDVTEKLDFPGYSLIEIYFLKDQHLALLTRAGLIIYDMKNKNVVKSIKELKRIRVSPKGIYLACPTKKSIAILDSDLKSVQKLEEFKSKKTNFLDHQDLKFSDNSQNIAILSKRNLQALLTIWDLKTAAVIFKATLKSADNIATSKTLNYMALRYNNKLIIYKTKFKIQGSSGPKVLICSFCKKNACFRCTNCSKVYYCSKECQSQHWEKHKIECIKS